MLKHELLHPQINEVLGRAGHSGKVLIADGNYPASSTIGKAALVSLNLSPGVVNCTQVLETLLSAIPIEAANTMQPEQSGPYALEEDPPIWIEFRQLLEEHGYDDLPLEPIPRWDFYEAVKSPDLVLTIQTADQRLFANLLLTIGVRRPDA